MIGLLFLLPPLAAFPLPDDPESVRRRGRDFLARGQWADAFDQYARIPPSGRTAEDRENYHACLRHVLQQRRLHDRATQTLVGRLMTSQTLNVYRDVLDTLQTRYVDRKKANLTDLFLHGVLELRRALEEEVFVRDHLPGARPEAVVAFKARLDALQEAPTPIATLKEARDQFHAVLLAALGVRLKPGVVLLEFICGACHALDEYTLYLGPRQLSDAEAEHDGRVIGIGLEVMPADGHLLVTRVHRDGPAEAADLRPGDRVVAIDGQPADPARLAGEDGTLVELEVARFAADGSAAMMMQTYRLERRPVAVPSVDRGEELRGAPGVGYIRLALFQKTTPHELKEAIIDLAARMGGLKALVLDLRGNPGGSYPAALQVAELFLPDGPIGTTHGRQRDEAHRANNPGAFAMPLVLLIDGDTASAAEVVAEALKERGRAKLVGRTTFGKGSVQDVFRIDVLRAGLRITIARFAPPGHGARDAGGVTPHYVTGRAAPADAHRDPALLTAERLLTMIPR